jgi:hypothetical protein
MPEGKRYLGDGVYGERENDWMVVLTTENGECVSNRIYMEPDVFNALLEWGANRLRTGANQTEGELLMPQEYRPALEVERIADGLIADYHTHLRGIRIVYIFLAEAPKVKGRELWGRAKLVTGLNAYLAGDEAETEAQPFFVMEIAESWWHVLDEHQKKALVDHELHHFDVDIEESKLLIRPHDVEEFAGVVRRYGLWREDVKAFVGAAKAGEQRWLFREKEKEESAEETKITLSHGGRSVTLIGEQLERAAKQ